jgi:hypothetical protein
LRALGRWHIRPTRSRTINDLMLLPHCVAACHWCVYDYTLE